MHFQSENLADNYSFEDVVIQQLCVCVFSVKQKKPVTSTMF